MALRATKPNEDAPQLCGAKPSGLPPGLESPLGVRAFCPARVGTSSGRVLRGAVTDFNCSALHLSGDNCFPHNGVSSAVFRFSGLSGAGSSVLRSRAVAGHSSTNPADFPSRCFLRSSPTHGRKSSHRPAWQLRSQAGTGRLRPVRGRRPRVLG
jgi:hypothetical protein